MTDADRDATQVVLALRDRLREALGRLVPGGPVALLDFPNHDNIGDTIIWQATRAYLADAGVDVGYTADHTGFSPRLLRRRLGRRGTVLLLGGGNFGDLWPTFQAFREHAIAQLHDHPIVQLPQSIHFRDPAGLDGARRVVDAHPDVTLLVRDEPSRAIAVGTFRARVELVPDMAFALGPLSAPAGGPRRPLWMARTDAETTGSAGACPDPRRFDVTDWPPDARDVRRSRAELKVAGKSLALTGGRVPVAYAATRRLQDSLTRRRVALGIALIGGRPWVVTDRLHGHILALLLGVPHAMLDNSYGKLRAFYDAWTHESPITFWANTAEEALAGPDGAAAGR